MRTNILTLSALAGLLAISTGLPVHADYQATVLADNPAGYWRLNNVPWISYATNLGAASSAANGVIGNLVREGVPGALAGDANPAMQFIGNGNSRIVVPYTYELNQGGSFTFECWMQSAFPKGDDLAVLVNRGGENGYVLYVKGDGTFSFNINMGPGGTVWSPLAIPAAIFAPLVGQWVHVACVYDAASGATFGTQYLYTNGVLAGQANPPRSPLPNPNGAFVIGDRSFHGLIDEVAAYATALNAGTVLAHYQAGTSGAGNYPAVVQASSPVGYWRLGETTGFAVPPTLANNLGSLAIQGQGNYGSAISLGSGGALASADTAAAFSGGTVMVPYNNALSPAGPFTAEAWLKPASIQTGANTVCALSLTEPNSPRSGWLLYQSAAGWNFRTYNTNSTTAAVDITTGPAPVLGTWYHVAVVWDGSVGTVYVNGVATSSAATTYVPTRALRNFVLGARSSGDLVWTGVQDEVAFYATALSASTIQAHYLAASTNAAGYAAQILASAPVGYWRLNDVAPATTNASNLGYLGAAGNGNFNGTSLVPTNDTPLVGDSDPATYFPGSSRIDIPLNEALVRTNAFSYEIWYKENPGVTGIRSPMWWRDEPTGGDTRGWVHYLQDLPGGRGNNFQSSSTATTWNGLSSANLFLQTQWQHLVCTWDGLVKQIYLDGTLIAVNTNDARYIKLVQRAVCSISSGSYPFNGFLDEAAYYTNALADSRVTAHYLAARGVNPPIVAVTFQQQPVSLNAYEGNTVNLKAVALGTPPFSYQWYKDGVTPVASQTLATLILAPALQGQSGDYTLWVTNGAGAVASDTVHVEIVAAPPTILAEPQSITRLEGATAKFTVQVGGSQPMHYQWRSNNIALPGATSATLTLPNVRLSYAANYSVTVTNLGGMAHSGAATLTVVAAPPGSYAAAIVAAQPQAYWRLGEATDQIAYDLVGGHDGAYDWGIVLGVPGAILGDSDTAANFPSWAGIQVPYSADLNSATAFTVECWVKADSGGDGSPRTLVSSRNREQTSNWHFGYYVGANSANQWEFNTGHKTSGVRTLAGGIVDANWHHLVCTYDDNTLVKNLYVDGQLVGTDLVPLNTFAPNAGYGANGDDPPPTDEGLGTTVPADRYSGQGLYFWGDLDEVAIYDYALSPAQVTQHQAVAGPPLLAINSTGSQVVVTWNKGLLLQANEVTGPWTTNSAAVSPWTNSPAGARKFFRALLP